MATALDSKVAIVTGSAGGLGKAIAKAFLRAGAVTVLSDVNANMLEEARTELSSLGRVESMAGDLTDPNTVAMLVETTIAKHGRLDILVNNAGIMDRMDPIGDVDMALWDRVLATNLTAPARLSQLAVREFLRQDRRPGGVILNVGSINGFRGALAGAAYVSAKHGLVGLTRNTAAFYATKDIRCNIIMPGVMKTNIKVAYEAKGRNEEAAARSDALVKLNPGAVDIDELAKLAVFACSDDARYLNGAVISTDCGWQAI